MHVKFVTFSYHSSTTDEDIQMQMSGVCNTLKKSGYDIISANFQYDSRHGKIMFFVVYR